MARQRDYYQWHAPLHHRQQWETEDDYRGRAASEMADTAIHVAGGIAKSVMKQQEAKAAKRAADEKLAEQVPGMADLIETIAVFEKAYREMRKEYGVHEEDQKRYLEYQIITILLENLIVLKEQIRNAYDNGKFKEGFEKLSKEELKAFHTALKQVCHTAPFHDFLESLWKVLTPVAIVMLALLALFLCYLVFAIFLAFLGHFGLLVFFPIVGTIAAVTASLLLSGLAVCGLMADINTRNGPFQLDKSAFPALAEKSQVIDQKLNSSRAEDKSNTNPEKISAKNKSSSDLENSSSESEEEKPSKEVHPTKAFYFSYQPVFQRAVPVETNNKAKVPTSTVFLSNEEATQLATNKIKVC